MGANGNSFLPAGGWQVSLAYRWLHSDRHFIGRVEQPQRQAQGSEVINDVHTFDLSLTYAINSRFSVSLTLPFVHADRSSLYEHDRVNRHHMKAGGLADIRLVGQAWLLKPEKYTNGNLAFGVGVKFPTGDYEATDYRYLTTGPVLRFVDNSIQPGDGGWGIMFEAQGFQKVFDRMFAYVNGTYLMNPREMVPSTGYSVWDAYLLRAGFNYAIWPAQNLSLSLGGRIEGVPPEDLVGGSAGSRRPGYAVSVEPGITWAWRKFTVAVNAPVSVQRNRQANFRGQTGDAAFADYLITSSISYRF